MGEGFIMLTPTTAQVCQERALVAAWKAEVAALEHETSQAVADEQRALEQRLGRQLTQAEVNDTINAGRVKLLPPYPQSRQARFARGERVV